MLPFSRRLVGGIPANEQVVAAVKTAWVTGQIRAGETFPSVRQLSRELHINPNTAQKVITRLIQMGLLESHPGIGTVVQQPPPPNREDITNVLLPPLDDLILEASFLGLGVEDLVEIVRKRHSTVLRIPEKND